MIDLVVDLLPPADAPRMPEADARAEIAGIRLPRLVLPAGGSDGAMRVLTALGERLRQESLTNQTVAASCVAPSIRQDAPCDKNQAPRPGSGSV